MQTGIPVVKVPLSLRFRGLPLAAISAADRSRLARLLAALAVTCLAGVALAGTILYVHGQIDRLGDSYTSFCSVNESINCDRVLSSSYAKIAGIPVAWMAAAAWAAMAAIFAAAARSSDDAARSRLLGLGAAGLVGALVFSGYMAVIAVFRLETLCLLCMGLYAVSLVGSGLAVAAVRTAATGGASPLPGRVAAALFVSAVVAVSLLGWFTWPRTGATLAASVRTAEDVARTDPDFHRWYTALPKVDPAGLVRRDQAALVRSGKVVIVDFFDLECGHCRRNHELARQLLATRPGQVELVHRHFPLDSSCNDIVTTSIHANACRAAEAVECAGLQGKREEMIEILFRNQGQLFAENLTRLGGKIGLDQAQLDLCIREHRTLPVVLDDARSGAKLDIKATPTVFIGGRRIPGVLEELGKYEMAVIVDSAPAASH